MFVVFRADANPQIGSGHVMRCLALAEALTQQGAQCGFLCRGAGLGEIGARIRTAGHRLIELPEGPPLSPSVKNLPHGWQFDADASLAALSGQPSVDWLVVDHYALDADWERRLRPRTRHILAIDDLADRTHDCDLLLDQNLQKEAEARYRPLLPAHCQLLLGPRHALLRAEFNRCRPEKAFRRPADVPRLLVMFGGADPKQLSQRVVNLLSRRGHSGPIDVIVGPLFQASDQLSSALAALPNARLHRDPANIAVLLASADLAIGSPGVSSWERCALGLPSIVIAVADNQIELGQALAEQHAHLYLGRDNEINDDQLAAAILLLTANRAWRQAMGESAATLCDGRGAARVARRMLAGVSIRRATLADARLLFDWRNDPRVRNNAFDPRPLVWETHRDWLQSVLSQPKQLLLIGQSGEHDIGCVRFDLTPETTRVSIYLDPNRLGEGLATPLLLAAEAELLRLHPQAASLQAEVRTTNAASLHAFAGAGYSTAHHVLIKTLPTATIAAVPRELP